MNAWAGKFLIGFLVIILIALVSLHFLPDQSSRSDATKGKLDAAPAPQDAPRPLSANASNPASSPNISGSMSDAVLSQQNLQRELEQLAASQSYKEMLARQARGEHLTRADLELLLKASDIKGRMVKEPRIEKSTKYPPDDAKTQEMWEWWRKMKAADPNFEYKRSVAFYGKVVDETGNPIQNVTIVASIAGPEGDKELKLTSDSQGIFKFEGQQGKFVTVDMDKRGYGRGPQSYGSFEYAEFFSERFHQPDPSNPVIFVLPRLNP